MGETVEVQITESVVCSPCPYATWTLWCPNSGTPLCINCPVYRDREKGTNIYVFPKDTDMKVT